MRGRFHEVQHAREERITRLRGAADVDHSGTLELPPEDIGHALERLIVERPESVIHEYPRRPLQDDARERERDLLVLTQLPVPAQSHIEHGLEALEPESPERVRERFGLEALHLHRISENLAQGAAWQVGSATRQVEDRLIARVGDRARAPR